MRRDLFSAVSSMLLVSFICTSSTPALALKPQETAEKGAGLEELADKLLAPFVPSPQETTRRDFLKSVAAGAAALGAAALPSSLIAAEKVVEKPITGVRVKFQPQEIILSDLPADLVKEHAAVLVFIENDNHPSGKEPGVWYVQPNNVDGAWHFPVRNNTVSVTTKREDHRAFRKGHVWIVLLKDEAAVKAFRAKVKTLPAHEGAEGDAYLAQRNRNDLSTLLDDAVFVEKTGLVAISVDSDGKAAQLVIQKSGLEENLTVAGALSQITRYIERGSTVVKYRGIVFSDAVTEITPSSGLFDLSVLRKAITTVARDGFARVELAGDGVWILPPAITSSTGVEVSVGAYELDKLASLGEYGVSQNGESLADRVIPAFGDRVATFDQVRAVGFYPPGFNAYSARGLHYVEVVGSGSLAVSAAAQRALMALGEIYPNALLARSLELRTGALWAPGINGPALLIGPTGVSSGLEERMDRMVEGWMDLIEKSYPDTNTLTLTDRSARERLETLFSARREEALRFLDGLVQDSSRMADLRQRFSYADSTLTDLIGMIVRNNSRHVPTLQWAFVALAGHHPPGDSARGHNEDWKGSIAERLLPNALSESAWQKRGGLRDPEFFAEPNFASVLMKADDVPGRIVYDTLIRRVQIYPGQLLRRQEDGAPPEETITHGNLIRAMKTMFRNGAIPDGYVEVRFEDGIAFIAPAIDWTLPRVLPVETAVLEIQYSPGIQTLTYDIGEGPVTLSKEQGGLAHLNLLNVARQVAGESSTIHLRIDKDAAILEAPPAAPDRSLDYASSVAPVSSGLEERPAPMIGFLSPLAGKEEDLSLRLLSGNPAAKGEATRILRGGLKNVADFDRAFGRLLAISRGNMEVFAQTFERFAARQGVSGRDALLAQVRRIAQDPGAPNNLPPVSYFNPARYVYARLQRNLLDGFVRDVLSEVVEAARGVSDSDLSDVERKKNALVQKLEEGRLTKGPYQYEIFWDSLVRKDGETYLTLELLLDGAQGYEKGVVLELQVVVPAAGEEPRYRGPYSLVVSTRTPSHFSVGLLDPIHFINTRFPEWRPKAQRDIYESRLQALKDSKEKDKRQFIRPSERQGNNPRFFEPFFRAFLDGNVPLAYHIVDALASERDYGNQGGVGSVGNLASAIVRRGGIGATASWLLEDPGAARTVAEKNRQLVYSYEKDHHRIDAIKDVKGFASELEPFLLAYPENLMTGWVSANLQDETKFINPDARKEALKAGETIAQTGVIDETVFDRLQETYNGKPVTEGLPNVFGMHWLRNRWLHDVVDTLTAQGVPITPFNRWYIEPDYALDGKPQTVEELAYLTLMSWVSAQAQGHPLGPVVPSYGNVHGASAGNPSLALAGILQYAAQAAPLYGEPLPADLLAIARKAPRGSITLAENASGYFKDLSLREKFLQVVTSAGERTEAEEAQLRGFVLAQLQKIPADVLKTLKEAEQVLLKEVAQAQKEKRQPLPLEEVAPVVAGNLSVLTARLDQEINTLPLERRAAITTHAASGLSAEQLSKAREYGVWVANKSTEFQNIITKQLEVVYLMWINPAMAREMLAQMPAAQAAWNAHPLSSGELQRVAALYQAMYDAAAKRAELALSKEIEKLKQDVGKANDLAKAEDSLAAVKRVLSGQEPLRPFPWFWRDNTGWSMEDPSGKDWSAYDWVPGAHGRYMFSMRDTMTGQGTENILLFPNALTWGLPPTVIRMAQAEIERTIAFYHQPSVMNAVGGAVEFRVHAGLEEKIQQAVQDLDAPSPGDRLQAVRTLLQAEQQGIPIPAAGPEMPSFLHIHTSDSYPGVPGSYSPAHMIWAAHQQGKETVYLVDHETVAHIGEGVATVRILKEGQANAKGNAPPKVFYGVEFRTWVDPQRKTLLGALARGVGGANGAAWVVGMGVPLSWNGQVSRELVQLVDQFQRAKRKRAEKQIGRLNEALGLNLSLEGVLAPDGNVTERAIANAAARALREQGRAANPSEIRAKYISPVSYDPNDEFPSYEQLLGRLKELGMMPAFTMQIPVEDFPGILPELKGLGIEALDLAGIDAVEPDAERKIDAVIRLAESNNLPVIGGADYRGTDAVGWPKPAPWMDHPTVRNSAETIFAPRPVLDPGSSYAMAANPSASGLEEDWNRDNADGWTILEGQSAGRELVRQLIQRDPTLQVADLGNFYFTKGVISTLTPGMVDNILTVSPDRHVLAISNGKVALIRQGELESAGADAGKWYQALATRAQSALVSTPIAGLGAEDFPPAAFVPEPGPDDDDLKGAEFKPAGLEEKPATARLADMFGVFRLSVDATDKINREFVDYTDNVGATKATLNPNSVGNSARDGQMNDLIGEFVSSDVRGTPLLWNLVQRHVTKEFLPRKETSIELDPTVPSVYQLALDGKNPVAVKRDGEFVVKPEFRAIIGKETLKPGEKLTPAQSKAVHKLMVRQWVAQALEIHRLGVNAPGKDGVNNATVKIGHTKSLTPVMGEWGVRVGLDVMHTLAVLGIHRNFTLGFMQEDAQMALQADRVVQAELDATRGLDLLTVSADAVLSALDALYPADIRETWVDSPIPLGTLEKTSPIMLPEQRAAAGYRPAGRSYFSLFASRVDAKVNSKQWKDKFDPEQQKYFGIVNLLVVMLTHYNDQVPWNKAHGQVVIPASLEPKVEGQPGDFYFNLLIGWGYQVVPTASKKVIDAFNARAADFTEAQLYEIAMRTQKMKRDYADVLAARAANERLGPTIDQAAAIRVIAERFVEEGFYADFETARKVVESIVNFQQNNRAIYDKMMGELYPEGDDKFTGPHMLGVQSVDQKIEMVTANRQSAQLVAELRRAGYSPIRIVDETVGASGIQEVTIPDLENVAKLLDQNDSAVVGLSLTENLLIVRAVQPESTALTQADLAAWLVLLRDVKDGSFAEARLNLEAKAALQGAFGTLPLGTPGTLVHANGSTLPQLNILPGDRLVAVIGSQYKEGEPATVKFTPVSAALRDMDKTPDNYRVIETEGRFAVVRKQELGAAGKQEIWDAVVAYVPAESQPAVPSVSADLKDAALVMQASKTGKVGQIIEDGEGGPALVLPAASLSSANDLYLHTGLRPPVDLPDSVTVEDLPETRDGVLGILGHQAVQDGDLIVLNADLVGDQAAEWIPALTTRPGRIRITPEQSATARTQDLAAEAAWSRLLGGVVDYGSVTVTYVTVRDTTYVVIRSA